MIRTNMTRRGAMLGLAGAAAAYAIPALAEGPAKVLVHRSPTCGCCGKWADALRAAGFDVTVVNESDMAPVKTRLGVPSDLSSCHTAEIGGYAVEGHVPVDAIQRLLRDKPKAAGIAAPGMPMGSPGMEMGAEKDEYEIVLFGPEGRKSFGKYRGSERM